MDVYITRSASYLPNEPVSNDEMEDILGRVNGKRSRARSIVLKQNGIKSRYYVIDKQGVQRYNNAQLTSQSVRKLEGDGFSIDQIDLLCCGTSSPDYVAPNLAVMVHGELGNPPCEAIATSGICAASTAALKYGFMSVKSGASSNAVVTGSEVASTFLVSRNFQHDERPGDADALEKSPILAFDTDFLRWMLSDGAGCVLLEREKRDSLALRIDWIELVSYANQAEPCMVAGANKNDDGQLKGWREYDSLIEAVKSNVFAIKQDVRLLHEYITELTLVSALKHVAAKHNLSPTDIDFFLPHYSSEFFRPWVTAGLNKAGFEIPTDRWFTTLTDKGNTGSASIFLMIDGLLRSNRLHAGQQVLCWIPESSRFTGAFAKLTAV